MAQINKDSKRDRLHHSEIINYSLKRLLLIRIFTIFFVVWLIGALFTKFTAFDKTRDFLEKQVNSQLIDWLQITSVQTLKPANFIDRSGRFIMLWQRDELMIHEGNFSLPQPIGERNYIYKENGHNWVIAENCLNTTCAVVGIKDTQRKFAVRFLVVTIFIPLLLVFILTLVGIYFAVTRALKPVELLTNKISNTSPDDLKPLRSGLIPQELNPLVVALNQLIERVQTQLQKERQFLDTCAHELRTPITGLITHIQALDDTHKELHQPLENIEKSAKRTIRVANQFLSFARNRNAQLQDEENSIFDLCELVRHICSDHMHDNPQLNCQMQSDSTIIIQADIMAIEIACQNIIENTLKYATKDTKKIQQLTTLTKDNDNTYIIFEDSGPGVPPSYYNKLLERFYRLPGQQNTGAGLGLTIVHEIVKRYQGDIAFDKSTSLGGLQVTLSFSNEAISL